MSILHAMLKHVITSCYKVITRIPKANWNQTLKILKVQKIIPLRDEKRRGEERLTVCLPAELTSSVMRNADFFLL